MGALCWSISLLCSYWVDLFPALIYNFIGIVCLQTTLFYAKLGLAKLSVYTQICKRISSANLNAAPPRQAVCTKIARAVWNLLILMTVLYMLQTAKHHLEPARLFNFRTCNLS